ncbi:GntR family transcriptional regulator [Photobacterium proteolyticum]|uniref:GntR family transcriptional regulator n=1 Tax=Photobacterium proteolyticum TaxID=1903952 RepID=A0A1Q9H176_9GAMM|nr:GntR family transcriptional regulator [Photobacterium proteolyticum]OLQ81377.1 GntR family transcriptional regulator [Photobacterium proteolyticum]
MPEKKQSELKKTAATQTGQTQDDVVYGHIFDAILEQRLPPNTKLNEEALGEIFGVSRTIIRRALLRLSVEQIVNIRPNRGAIVAAPSVEEAKQVLKAREVLELAITELAVDNATNEQIASLRQLVEEEHQAFEQGDIGRGIRLSGEFHIQLGDMANNSPLLSFQRSIVSQTSLIISLYEVGTRSQCSFDEHNDLLDAIEAGDKAKAISLMKTHLEHIKSKLALDEEAITKDLHAVFSDVIKKK